MRGWRLAVSLVVSPVVTGSGQAQGSLAEAAERVRQAWLAHNVQAVVGQSASVVLQIPGADPSAPVLITTVRGVGYRFAAAAGTSPAT